MANSVATVSLFGLEEVQEYFSTKRIKKAVAIGLANFTLELHGALRTSIHNRYTGNQDINRQLVKGSSTVQFGRNVVKTGLTYKIKHQDLSKFSYTAKYGALNKGDGWVHTVEVVRGKRKIVKGKGRGGFTPRVGSSRTSHGRPKRIFRGGAQMLERKGKGRLPLRVLYAPSTANMINRALSKDVKVLNTLNSMTERIGEFIDA